jgi:hypothetical protein
MKQILDLFGHTMFGKFMHTSIFSFFINQLQERNLMIPNLEFIL